MPASPPADRLRALQAEAADVAPRADGPAAIAGAVGVRAVLDQRQPVAPRDVGEAVQRRRVAPHMHDADRARPRRDPALDVVGVGRQRARVDVAEDRRPPHWRIGAAVAKNV